MKSNGDKPFGEKNQGMGDQMIIEAEIGKIVQKLHLIKSTPNNCVSIKPPASKTTHPYQITGEQLDKDKKEVVRTRPMCPYPKFAKYNGTGSIDDAANFICVDK